MAWAGRSELRRLPTRRTPTPTEAKDKPPTPHPLPTQTGKEANVARSRGPNKHSCLCGSKGDDRAPLGAKKKSKVHKAHKDTLTCTHVHTQTAATIYKEKSDRCCPSCKTPWPVSVHSSARPRPWPSAPPSPGARQRGAGPGRVKPPINRRSHAPS